MGRLDGGHACRSCSAGSRREATIGPHPSALRRNHMTLRWKLGACRRFHHQVGEANPGRAPPTADGHQPAKDFRTQQAQNPVGRGPVCGAHDLPEARPMTKAPESHPSITVYTSTRLALYDLFILCLSCRLVWRGPKRHFLDLYNRNVGTPHLDIGVGTGYFLDRCRFPVERPEITLLDL